METQAKFRCTGCKEMVREDQFKAHIVACTRFEGIVLKQIRNSYKKAEIIQLKFIVAELEVCQQLVKNQITKTQLQLIQKLKKKQLQIEEMKRKLSGYNKLDNPKDEKQVSTKKFADLFIKPSKSNCRKCNKQLSVQKNPGEIIKINACNHEYCLKCVKEYIENSYVSHYGSLPCIQKDCKSIFLEDHVKTIIGQNKHKQFELQYKSIIRKTYNLAQCKKCRIQFQFVPSYLDVPTMKNNKALSLQLKRHYSQNRFICPNSSCRTQQCKQCGISPFHTGMTCKEAKDLLNKQIKKQMPQQIPKPVIIKEKKCRYCQKQLTSLTSLNSYFPALYDICNSPSCKQLSDKACNKHLPCGHYCYGLRGQAKCPPCLRTQCCKNKPEMNQQNYLSFCKICKRSTLKTSPCVRSKCGHIFHQKCVKMKLQKKSSDARISFNFCQCPQCKKVIDVECPQSNSLFSLNKQVNQYYKNLQKIALKRLQSEGASNDPRVVDPKSPYYKKYQQYALLIYSYYECFKCKQPYYGGKKSADFQINYQNILSEVRREELICPSCTGFVKEVCGEHGLNFAEFKCKFCCSNAVWYEKGNHFCDVCFKIKDHVLNLSKSRLPECDGPSICPIGGFHGLNGQEALIRCSICKRNKKHVNQFRNSY